ncbi:PAS domain S-box protein, partial [bacterium]|nr:PAS domain S-box protein [bacterium]
MKTKLLIPKKTKAQLINELEELQKRLAEAEIAEVQDGGSDNGFLKSFRNLAENLPVSILIHCEEKCIYLNRSAVGVLGGKSAEDFKGKSIWDFIHPDYRDLAKKRLDSVYSKGEWAHLVEEKFIRIDGKIIDVEIGGSAIDYAGKPATQIVFRDITKRDERERQIRYLADLVENVSDAVISTDMDFKILSWNKAAEDLYGWTRHEVKGKTVKDVTRIEYPANNQEDVLREFSRTGFWKGEVIQKRKDGTPLTIHASVSLVRDRAGKPAGAVAINRDITERKQAEEALRESEDRFRTLLETAYDGAGIHENGRLIEVNQALASMLGYEPSEMIGMEAFQFVVPESWQLVKESIQSEFDKPYEVVAVRKDGSTFPIEIIGKSCRYQGRQVRVSAVRDITARKESVETLRRERDFTKSLIDTAQTIILSLDTEGRIIHFNPYMEEVTGYRLEDVQGKDWCTTFIPKRDQKRIRNLFLKAVSGIQTRGNINSILTKEGHERE